MRTSTKGIHHMASQYRALAPRFLASLLIASVVAAGICWAAPVAKVDLTAANERIAQPAWLDARLPAHTVAYARIPSFWGLLSAPDGRALDPALGSAEHVRIIASLRDAVRRNQLIAQTGAAPALNLFLSDMGAPMELALIDFSDQVTPAGNILMTTRVDVRDIAALNARMVAMAGTTPFLKAPFDANGQAELQTNGVLQFDLASHRLYAFVGIGATRAGLDDAIKQLASTRAHPMQDIEREIDTSGQGLFLWLNMKGVGALIAGTTPGLQPGTLTRDLLDHSQNIAIGWGTVAGRGRMQFLLTAPGARLLDYLGQTRTDPGNLKTAGKPRWVATLALPGAEQMQAIESNLDRDYGVGTQQKYRELVASMQARIGFGPMDFARTIGPELYVFADANGTFDALRMRDRAGFYALLDQMGKRFGWRSAVTRAGNVEIHELHIPGTSTPAAQQGADPHAEAWARLFARIGHHFYWVEDGDFLVVQSVPQPLIDRAGSKLDTRLGDWLRDAHNGREDETLLGLSGTSDNAQRDMYYAYLNVLQALGDVLDQPVNVMSLPTANGMQLPINGIFGANIEAGKSRLGFSLSYEQSPMELVTNSGGVGVYATIFTGAMFAAIAIPAYQDYTIRSQVAEGETLAEGSKIAVATYYLTHRHYPPNNVAAGIASPASIHGSYVSSVTILNGTIEVAFGGPQANVALPATALLVFAPRGETGKVTWSCNTAAGTTVDVKYRPMACRP